jgi:hypothetical protein
MRAMNYGGILAVSSPFDTIRKQLQDQAVRSIVAAENLDLIEPFVPANFPVHTVITYQTYGKAGMRITLEKLALADALPLVIDPLPLEQIKEYKSHPGDLRAHRDVPDAIWESCYHHRMIAPFYVIIQPGERSHRDGRAQEYTLVWCIPAKELTLEVHCPFTSTPEPAQYPIEARKHAANQSALNYVRTCWVTPPDQVLYYASAYIRPYGYAVWSWGTPVISLQELTPTK